MAGFAVIGLTDAYVSSLGIFLDTFELIRQQVTNLYRTHEPVSMQSQIQLLTPGGRAVRMAGGRSLSADGGLDNFTHYDLIYLPSFLVVDETSLDTRLGESGALLRWLLQQYAAGARVTASGPAVFLLAEAGLLDGGTAAIGRSLIPLFHRRYPHISIDRRAPVVEHQRVVTGTGLATDAQLLARLVELAITPELAAWLRDVTSQHQGTDEHLADDPLTANAQRWLEERFAQEIRISDLAAAMSVSQQTLLRHFQRHLKLSPQEYVRHVRMRSAQELLARTSRTIGQIATLVGYNDIQAFRKVFKEITGKSPSQYRAGAAGHRQLHAATA